MPWSMSDPPPPAKNWPDEDKRKCIAAANAVLEEGGTEQQAIYACIHAAGREEKMKEAEKRDVDPNVGGGVDRDKLKDSDFVFSDERKFPVVTPGDVSDAVHSWGRYKGSKSFEQFKRRLIALCRRKGPKFVAALPDEWKVNKGYVKAVLDTEDWVLDVLGAPFGGPVGGKDSHGEYFSPKTDFQLDRFGLPPVVYYHGYDPDGDLADEPAWIGDTVKTWTDNMGRWFRVVLKKTSEYAKRVWEAAKRGTARASTGTVRHLTRRDSDGRIRLWPIAELSLFDVGEGREPANAYAVAIPVMKALYQRAGLSLPDNLEPETQAKDASTASPSGAKGRDKSNDSNKEKENKEFKMDAKEIRELATEAAHQAVKAEREAQEKARQEEEAKESEFKARLEKEPEKWEAETAKANRLPYYESGAPAITRHGFTRKYDNLDPAEHALMLTVQEKAYQRGIADARRPSDACIKALALKVESEAKKDGNAEESLSTMKMFYRPDMKTNEINYSTSSSYGDDWVGVLYSNKLWEKIRSELWVLQQLEPYSERIPDGFESDVVPLESTDPIFYKVSQTTGITSTSGYRPTATITASPVGTGQKTCSLVKMGARILYTGEMQEDSLIRFAANAMRQLQRAGLESMEHALIDGDTDTSATTNINDIAGTPGGSEVFLLVNGFRKLPLVTNTNNSRSAGALTEDDYLETVKLLGAAGINAVDQDRVWFIVDMNTYWKSLQLAAVKTKDVWTRATLENGRLTGLWGYTLRPSAFMHWKATSAGYERKANTSGKVDQDTGSNNTTGSILAVRWDQWRMKWKRRMTIETDRYIEADTNQIVAMMRWGLAYRDTEASAISYNVTL